MKNLKLLNKKNLSIILFFSFFGFESQSQEPVDIWNVETKKKILHKIMFMKDSLKKQIK